LVRKQLDLEMHDHPHPYPLGWMNKDVYLKFTKQCKLRFVIIANFIDEIEVNVMPLDVYIVVLGSPYMYMMNDIFVKVENQYCLIKDGKSLIINAYKEKSRSL
jgi:hypothetical protein